MDPIHPVDAADVKSQQKKLKIMTNTTFAKHCKQILYFIQQ